MGEFIDVYSKTTGKKHRVPAHFMDNPRIAAPFRKTPKASAAEPRDLGTATPATDVITVPSEDPKDKSTTLPGSPGATETPAAGAKE
jgi:hypothetical protein